MILSSTPAVLEVESIAACIDGIIDKITHAELDKGEIVHELIFSLSSAASMKKIGALNDEEMNYLVNRLFQSDQHNYAPSGKKIMNTISIEELNNFLQ